MILYEATAPSIMTFEWNAKDLCVDCVSTNSKGEVHIYQIVPKSGWTCSCPAFKYAGKGKRCKHTDAFQADPNFKALLSNFNVFGTKDSPQNRKKKITTASAEEIIATASPKSSTSVGTANKTKAPKQRFPRSIVDDFVKTIKKALTANCSEYEVVGSYRRGLPTCGDIDILCTKANLNKMCSDMEKLLGDEFELIMQGEHILRGKYKGVMYDINNVPKPEEYVFYLLYRTGSADHNISMRGYAKKLGYRLNEHGLFDASGQKIPCKTEKDIYDALGLEYMKPSERNGKVKKLR